VEHGVGEDGIERFVEIEAARIGQLKPDLRVILPRLRDHRR